MRIQETLCAHKASEQTKEATTLRPGLRPEEVALAAQLSQTKHNVTVIPAFAVRTAAFGRTMVSSYYVC